MITIDYKSRQPIYEQLVDRIKQLILSGIYQRDDQLPTVRQLAQELAINPNTIQKAYAELERQGITYSLKGRGSFVGSSLQELSDVKKEQLMKEFADTVAALMKLGVTQEELTKRVQEIYRAEEGEA